MPQIPDDMAKFEEWSLTWEAGKDARLAEKQSQLYLRCGHNRRKYEECGYGLAGGGLGPYTYCRLCYAIDEKFEEME